ncbi:LuxR C-terminal-related transcriptional regulator [Nonomuraea fuscirosea]|uniref:helix-turn-helix transcriptional regulator n=1 Tax=Nonomuraea fuscirosea TaxID=1291556 RepID=UPI00343EFA82
MARLSAGDYRSLLELATIALERVGPDFPETTVSARLRELFDVDVVGSGTIDLVHARSRRWGTSPAAVSLGHGRSFHEIAVHHPLTLAYRDAQQAVPLRLSDVTDSTPDQGSLHQRWLGAGVPRILTIPLVVTADRITALALMRTGPDFDSRHMRMAKQLQSVLAGICALRSGGDLGDREAPVHFTGCLDEASGIRLTDRESAVLDLLGTGLIATAIGRRLDISRSTVEKHIQHIYEKLNTNDRISTVLKAQALGLIASTGSDAGQSVCRGPSPKVGTRLLHGQG